MTSLIEEIRQKVADEQFEFSKHAVDQSILRQIQVQEIREAIANGQVIEDYPNDIIRCKLSHWWFDASPTSHSYSMQLSFSPPA